MNNDEAREILDRYIAEVWVARDPGAVRRFASETYVRHRSPGLPPLTRDEQIERLRGFQDAFPDITIEVVDVVAADDLIAFRSIMAGTHTGEFMGRRPTNRRIEVGLVDMMRVREGLFYEQWGGPDMLDLLRQLDETP